jgi:hypothetical protein
MTPMAALIPCRRSFSAVSHTSSRVMSLRIARSVSSDPTEAEHDVAQA